MIASTDLLQEFSEQGFVVVRGVLDETLDLAPVRAEYETVLDELIRAWRAESPQSAWSGMADGLPFGPRLIQFVAESRFSYGQHFDISLPQKGITDTTPIHCGPAVFNLLRSPRLLDWVEKFVGPEIYSNPVQHTRLKLPVDKLPPEAFNGLTGDIAWHQDQAVIVPEGDQTDILTVWFPMNATTVRNGCLSVAPRSHLPPMRLHCSNFKHTSKNQVCIPDALVDPNQIPLPMNPGDVLFMHRRTLHRGLTNRSDEIRWSFDLRYQRIGDPTGRPWFPGFVVRSQRDPASELRSHEAWRQLWHEARQRLAGHDVSFNRWDNADPLCA